MMPWEWPEPWYTLSAVVVGLLPVMFILAFVRYYGH